jgi:hypothetical protein
VARAPSNGVVKHTTARNAPVSPAGDVLWDQPTDGGGSAFVDTVFPDFPTFDTYIVCDVVVEDPGWNITGVTTYFTDPLTFPAESPATLNIFEKTGVLPDPGDDPTSGMQVNIQIVTGVFGLEMVASGLDVHLDPGEYWIGLTPEVSFGQFGQAFHLPTFFPQGDASAARNPGGAFDLGTDWVDAGVAFGGVPAWDAAIRIDGTLGGGGGCFADCDGNGELNILDFVCYQGLFQSGDPGADCDGNGQLNILDFVCFQGEFQAGCP